MTKYNLYKDETPVETNEETPLNKAKKEREKWREEEKRRKEIKDTPPILRIIATSIIIIAFMALVITLVWFYSEMSKTIPEMIEIIKSKL